MKDGPTTYTATVTTCHGCRHLDIVALKDGRGGTCAARCLHPDVFDPIGMDGSQLVCWGPVVDPASTPEWCPHLKSRGQ